MAWEPTYSVINARAIADNLLAYFETNQAAALTWAGGGSLKPFKKFSNSVGDRLKPVFPSIAFSDDNDAVDYTLDLPEGAYSLTFQLSIQNADPDTATTQARVYALAVLSMIRNCPPDTLAANTHTFERGNVLESMECGFDPIMAHENRQNDFLQVLQIRTVFKLQAEGLYAVTAA